MSEPRVTIKIQRALYHRIRGLIHDSGFRSPTEFIVHVLRDLLAEGADGEGDALSHNEVRAIRTRLRRLGYLPAEMRPPEEER